MSENIQLGPEEHKLKYLLDYSKYNISEFANKTGIPQYELMENNLMAQIVYAAISYIVFNEEKTIWENLLETINFIASSKYKIELNELDEKEIQKIVFKLGEAETFNINN